MSKIILQPAGNKDAREHYVDTIQNPISINRISQFVNQDDLNILKNIYSEGAYIWGVTPGTNLSNKNKWNRIERGDTALFSKEGHIFASGTVTYKIHNKNLALDLWDTDINGATWEYVFFLDEIKQLRIPYLDFNRAIGYSDKFVIQGFSVLDEEKSLKLFESFDLRSDAHLPDIDAESGMQASLELDKLNKKREVYVRLEQGYLRKKIFNYKSVSNCSICDKKLNIEFLVCAHIKKRSKCDDKEKRNISNVTPMCKFGCDELFERGYIVVEKGKIKVMKNNNTDFVNNYLEKLDGKTCAIYSEHNEIFFKWHREFHNN
ncbi:HNH endonuclease [bacterium]|nr:HNH endonuclease [bacterium]